jgi:hypothetical protein
MNSRLNVCPSVVDLAGQQFLVDHPRHGVRQRLEDLVGDANGNRVGQLDRGDEGDDFVVARNRFLAVRGDDLRGTRNAARGIPHPCRQLWIAVNRLPHVVADAFHQRELRIPTGCPNGFDHAPGFAGRNHLVLLAVEGPDRDVAEFLRLLRVTAAGNRDDGRPETGAIGRKTPGSVAPHRPAGENPPFRIDAIRRFDVLQNPQCAFAVDRVAVPAFQQPAAEVFALREHDDERERFRVAADHRPEADRRRPQPVGAALAGAVQKQHHRPLPAGGVILRDEDGITMRTVGVPIHAADELRLSGRSRGKARRGRQHHQQNSRE